VNIPNDFILSEVTLILAVPSYGPGSASPLDYVLPSIDTIPEIARISASERLLTLEPASEEGTNEN